MNDEHWLTSPERKKALLQWSKPSCFATDDLFEHSQEFANARHAYRKRINGKENDN